MRQAAFLRAAIFLFLGSCIPFPQLPAQMALDNSIIPWSGRHGLIAGTSIDEGSLDIELRYQRFSLRTGWHAGISVPMKTGITRSPGLSGGFIFFPNAFHSRMDPFLQVRALLTHEEGQYRADIPANALLSGRPLAWTIRLQGGYGFNIHFGKYIYLQHLLGIGYAIEMYPAAQALGKATLVLGVGAGYHIFSKLKDRKRAHGQG